MFSFAFKSIDPEQLIDKTIEADFTSIIEGTTDPANFENVSSIEINGVSYTPLALPTGLIDLPKRGDNLVRVSHTLTSSDLTTMGSARVEITLKRNDNLGAVIISIAGVNRSTAGLIEEELTYNVVDENVVYAELKLIEVPLE
jgi:hypothetical protein